MKNVLPNNHAARPAIERVPTAARRMGVSFSHVYREIKAGRLYALVKLGERSSGLYLLLLNGVDHQESLRIIKE